MTVKMYLFTLVSRGVSMPGMGGQYAPEYPNIVVKQNNTIEQNQKEIEQLKNLKWYQKLFR
jgi:hypothetical protein